MDKRELQGLVDLTVRAGSRAPFSGLGEERGRPGALGMRGALRNAGRGGRCAGMVQRGLSEAPKHVAAVTESLPLPPRVRANETE